MATKYRRNCKLCLACRNNPKLRNRLYQIKYHRETSDDSYRLVAEDSGGQYSYAAVSNHANKHITEGRKPITYLVAAEKKIERTKQAIAKELEVSFDHETAVPKQDFEQVWDAVIVDGLTRFKSQKVAVTVNQLLAATKLKSDYNMKKRGQDVEIIKTMYSFNSKKANHSGQG